MKKNVLFLRDFDEEARVSGQKSQNMQDALTREEFDRQLAERLDKVRSAAYDEGYNAGRSEALASLEARQAAAIEAIAPEISDLGKGHEAYCRNLEIEMTTFMRDLCDKLFPELGREFLQDRVRTEIAAIARRAIGSPWLEIRIPQGLGEISKTLPLPVDTGVDIKIIEDAELEGACVKARWRNGRSEYNFDAICEKITSLLRDGENNLKKEEA